MSPAGAGEGFENIEAGTGTLTYIFYVGGEGQGGGKGDSQDLGGPTECEVGTLPFT